MERRNNDAETTNVGNQKVPAFSFCTTTFELAQSYCFNSNYIKA
jgi:hypothetical protein